MYNSCFEVFVVRQIVRNLKVKSLQE